MPPSGTCFAPALLKGRSALITGGGTGICRGIALALASAGCNVAISSRQAEHLQSTAQEISSLGVHSSAIPGDVRKPEEVAAVVEGSVSALGGLDILVNGAAGNFIALAEHL